MQPTPGPANKDELRGQIRKIIVETSGIDPRTLNNQTRIADLGLDGLHGRIKKSQAAAVLRAAKRRR